MSQRQFLALLGFAFVAAWIGFDFGSAVLCLVGAAVFAGVAAVLQGQVDLGELQQRVRSGAGTQGPDPYGSPAPAPAPSPAYPPPPRVR